MTAPEIRRLTRINQLVIAVAVVITAINVSLIDWVALLGALGFE